MHSIQEKILTLIKEGGIEGLTLRQIGHKIGETLPQKVKHHLNQLEKKGFILIDKDKKRIVSSNDQSASSSLFVSIPIIGSANCGPATIYADQNIQGYLKISRKLVTNKKGIFAIIANGSSMNKANINKKNIEDGDFLIIDSGHTSPRDGDYVLSIIDGMANIKKYKLDKKDSRIALISESTQNYNPIFIHKSDDFRINGKVIDIIKKINC